MTFTRLYPYPQSNDVLIRQLKLQAHPEGGHYAVTFLSSESIPSPYVSSAEKRLVQTTIYYLLSAQQDADDNHKEGIERIANHRSAIGVMHKNKSTTMHLHHAGRVIYTLLSTSKPVQIRTVVMGENMSKGEVRQLLVDGNWWKVSEIPLEDRRMVERGQTDSNYVGGLISEVVTPGFDWKDHAYMNQDILHDLFEGDETMIERFLPYCRI